MNPTFGSLFAGIGGFDLGFERAGLHQAWAVEIDPHCRTLLAHRFPSSELFSDVRDAGMANLSRVDVITAGFPCQDLSIAGKRAGLRGQRSGLFYEVVRIVSELKPRFLVWENVPGLLTSDKGRDFARVLAALADVGYFGAWRVLDAQYIGVAQRRRRVFGVFARSDIGAECAAEILSLAEGLRGHPAPSRQAGKEVAGPLGSVSAGGGRRSTDLDGSGAYITGTLTCAALDGSGPCGGDGRENLLITGTLTQGARGTTYSGQDAYSGLLIAHTLRAEGADASEDGSGRGTPLVAFSCKDSGADANGIAPTLRAMNFAGSHQNGGGQVAVSTRHGVRRLTPLECERLQGFPDGWTAGFSDSIRYRMIGNAVAVPCAQWIGRRLRRVSE